MVEPKVRGAAWFAGDWLTLREGADHVARSADLTQRLAYWVLPHQASDAGYRLVDLGCGTGSNMRYLAARLPPGQSWLLVDQDPDLLADAERLCASLPRVSAVAPRQLGIEAKVHAAIPAGSHIVSGSALLDLMSATWMEQLAARVCELSAAALFTLSYSGDFTLTPELEDDVLVRQAVNRHQRSDKGSGCALGPDAWSQCAQSFESRGYRVYSAPSPWRLDARHRELQGQLFAGWAEAAAEQQPQDAERIEAWLARRVDQLDSSEARTEVFHQDVLALPGHPPGTSPSKTV